MSGPEPSSRSLRYQVERERAELDLSDNANLWGTAPAVEAAVQSAPPALLSRYPSLYGADLKDALAHYAGVTADRVCIGCGSDDIIDAALRTYGRPGMRLVHPEPTFSMVKVYSRLNQLEEIPVPYRVDGQPDVAGMLRARPDVLYLCTPNNPTGAEASLDHVVQLLGGFPGLLLLDEAYVEFSPTPGALFEHLRDNPRVIVFRTLSKAFGLAGLRVGYALGTPAQATALEQTLGPYKLNGLAERAASVAVTQGVEWMRAHVTKAVEVRERLATELRARGLQPFPSRTNFLFVPLTGAKDVAEKLRARGIAVRAFSGLVHPGDAIRVGVGPWPLMERFLHALDEVRA